MMRYLALIGFIFSASAGIAQTGDDSTTVEEKDTNRVVSYWIYDTAGFIRIDISEEDTMFVYEFEEFIIRDFSTEEQRKEFEKLKYNVRKVLPYAKLAAFRLQMMEDNLNMISSKREREKYIKETEKAIKDEFMETLKKMSRSQGILLIKLIHRETGKSTFEILKGYRGSTETFYWSMFARMYKADLKSVYDPILDYQIEYIIKHYKLE